MTLNCAIIPKPTYRHILQRSFAPRLPVRCIATTTASSPIIPPESPRYIDIPQPPQQQEHRKPIVKGVLPIPRKIFRGDSHQKVTKEYLAAVTPEPTTAKGLPPDPSTKAYVEWKTQGSAMRRRNLREGLVELRKRKTRIDKRVAAQSVEKKALYERAVHKPEREDERLTRPTVTTNMTPISLTHIPDPNRKERIALKKERVAAREQEKTEERRNALHSLYMNARSFIVTEEALDAEVDRVFDDPSLQGRSIWDRDGVPDSIKGLMNSANKNSNNAIEQASGHIGITKRRVQRIAEELTGGKMD